MSDFEKPGATIPVDIPTQTVGVLPNGRYEGVEVQDEGVPQGKVEKIDFTGGGVSASVAGGVATVNVPGGGAGANREYYQFGRNVAVPGAGTLQLQGPGVTTAGVRLERAGTITGASIQVDVADGVRSYNLDIRKNGVSVATLALPAGSIGANTTAFAVAVVAGDVITAFLVKTAGGGASTFGQEQATVEVSY